MKKKELVDFKLKLQKKFERNEEGDIYRAWPSKNTSKISPLLLRLVPMAIRVRRLEILYHFDIFFKLLQRKINPFADFDIFYLFILLLK